MEALKETCKTVDGKNPAPAEVGSLSHYLQGYVHPNGIFLRQQKEQGFCQPRASFKDMSYLGFGWLESVQLSTKNKEAHDLP